MNVVIVNDFGHVNGGLARVALSSAQALARRGHAVTLLTAVPEPAGERAPAGVSLICTGQHEIVADPSRVRASIQGVWNLRAQRAMRALLDDLDPASTVIHFHGWTKALSSSVIRESLCSGFRTVTTLHDYFFACPNGGFFNYQTGTSCRLDPLGAACVASHCDARSYPQKLWRVGRQIVQRRAVASAGGLRHFISVSEFSARILRPHLPATARIHAVANPVDVPRGERAAVQDHAGVVCVGRLSPEKGGVLLARACHELGVPVTFVGDGPMRDAIVAACPAARMTGWLDAAQVRAQIGRSRALVLPSLWYETQGLVVSEAAALGVPAIVPDRCAARDSVRDGVTGLWFRSGELADLKDKLARVSAEPALAAAMGAAAFDEFWRDPPTLHRHVGELERVYGQVLAEA